MLFSFGVRNLSFREKVYHYSMNNQVRLPLFAYSQTASHRRAGAALWRAAKLFSGLQMIFS
jgi:hypothetical protein